MKAAGPRLRNMVEIYLFTDSALSWRAMLRAEPFVT